MEGLGMSYDALTEKYALLPGLGAIIGAMLLILAGYQLVV
jgi:hypothetical protein